MICLSDFQYMQKDHKIAGFFFLYLFIYLLKSVVVVVDYLLVDYFSWVILFDCV